MHIKAMQSLPFQGVLSECVFWEFLGDLNQPQKSGIIHTFRFPILFLFPLSSLQQILGNFQTKYKHRFPLPLLPDSLGDFRAFTTSSPVTLLL
jgi:hypothetical protein